jgi:hypothetical protein
VVVVRCTPWPQRVSAEWGGATRDGCGGEVAWGSAAQDGRARGEMAAAAMQSGASGRPHGTVKAWDGRASRETFLREIGETYRKEGLLGRYGSAQPHRHRKAASGRTPTPKHY